METTHLPRKVRCASAGLLNIECTKEASLEIALRSRGTPRVANALLRRVRDFAMVKGSGKIDLEIARFALEALNIDKHGLDEIDNKILTTIIDKFKGGPVGLSTIATALGEDAFQDTLIIVFKMTIYSKAGSEWRCQQSATSCCANQCEWRKRQLHTFRSRSFIQ